MLGLESCRKLTSHKQKVLTTKNLIMKTKLHYLIIALIFGFGMNAQITGPVTITGTGTGGWTQPGQVALTTTDGGTTWTATNFEIVGDGQMKFSEDGTWTGTAGFVGENVAPFGFPSGTAVVNGGNNIGGTLGFWSVTYNAVTKAYSFNPVVKIKGGGLAEEIQMTTGNGTAYSKKSVFFPGGDASFIQTSPTAKQWGGAFPDGPAVNDATITVPTGAFNVYFVLPGAGPAEYVFEPTVVSMIGNFKGSGWGTDIDLETVDNVNYTLSNWVSVVAGGTDAECHLKIRDNHDWTVQYGGPTSANGGNDLALTGTSMNGINGGGGDIFIPWGTYDVNFNRSTGTWTFTDLNLSTTKFTSSNLTVYPNPSNNNWNLSSSNEQINSVQIIDALGKVVMTKNINATTAVIDASNLVRGIYFAKVTSASSSRTIKLIKN